MSWLGLLVVTFSELEKGKQAGMVDMFKLFIRCVNGMVMRLTDAGLPRRAEVWVELNVAKEMGEVSKAE